MLGLQGICLLILPHASSTVLFFLLAAVVYHCYGGFGTMPATAGDYFGVKNAGAIYGPMIIAWSLAGVAGPFIASALIGDDGNYSTAYTTLGIIALIAVGLTFITRMPRPRPSSDEEAAPARAT